MALSNVLVTERCTSSVTVVVVASLVLLAAFGSSVPSEATVALFAMTVPLSTVESSVTWTVKDWLPPAARPVSLVQVTTWPVAEQVARGAGRLEGQAAVERVA